MCAISCLISHYIPLEWVTLAAGLLYICPKFPSSRSNPPQSHWTPYCCHGEAPQSPSPLNSLLVGGIRKQTTCLGELFQVRFLARLAVCVCVPWQLIADETTWLRLVIVRATTTETCVPRLPSMQEKLPLLFKSRPCFSLQSQVFFWMGAVVGGVFTRRLLRIQSCIFNVLYQVRDF